MNHSNTHPHMTQLSAEAMKDEVKKCDEKIKSVTGMTPTLFRPPYGDYNDQVVQALREIDHYTIQWDVEPPATVGICYYTGVCGTLITSNLRS